MHVLHTALNTSTSIQYNHLYQFGAALFSFVGVHHLTKLIIAPSNFREKLISSCLSGSTACLYSFLRNYTVNEHKAAGKEDTDE